MKEYTDQQLLDLTRDDIHVLAVKAAYLDDHDAIKLLDRRKKLLEPLSKPHPASFNRTFDGDPTLELGVHAPMNLNIERIKTILKFIHMDCRRIESIAVDKEYSEDFKRQLIKKEIGYLRETLDELETALQSNGIPLSIGNPARSEVKTQMYGRVIPPQETV